VYFDELDKANNLKKQLEIEIAELQLKAKKQAESNVKFKDEKIHTETSSEADGSTAKQYMSSGEVAAKLHLSESTIYHKTSNNEIPCHRIGRKLIFIQDEIDEWLKSRKPVTPVPEKLEIESIKKKKRHFIFTVPLDPFTNVFVREGYMDHDNAILMNDRFSKNPQKGDNLIQWQKDLRSLMTFIYLADRLDFIDKSISSSVRQHNTSSDEEIGEGTEVKYQVLVEENFKFTAERGSSSSSLSRAWDGVNGAINKLREQVADKKSGSSG
jgi:excisionase family DNA binding protein